MILGDELTPLSQLSAAFLAPKSALHLQFAYYESALAVEFLVQTAGLPALKGILDDLGTGKTINEALPARTQMTLDQLDEAFARFARQKAERVAPGATWEEIDLADDASSEAVAAWLKNHPKSFRGRQRLAARLVAERKWPEAKAVLLELKALYPEYVGAGERLRAAGLRLQAHVRPRPRNTRSWRNWRRATATPAPAYLRLMELDEAAGNWEGVARNAHRLLAVNPLIPAPHR